MQIESGVYRLVDLTTGCQYIGSAIDLERRGLNHFAALRRGNHYNKKLQIAYDLNPESIEFEILERCPLDEKRIQEQVHIDRSKAAGKVFNVHRACHGNFPVDTQ
jgi:hypothetical protein